MFKKRLEYIIAKEKAQEITYKKCELVLGIMITIFI